MANRILHKATLILSSATLAFMFATAAGAQNAQGQSSNHDHDGMGMDTGDTQRGAGSPEARAATEAMSAQMSGSMSGHDMNMSAHMFMTDLRPANAADEKLAEEILAQLRPA